jgi:hypothetical protein
MNSKVLDKRPNFSMEDRDKLKFSAVERRPAFSALENNLNCSTLDKSFTAELGLSATFMNLH